MDRGSQLSKDDEDDEDDEDDKDDKDNKEDEEEEERRTRQEEAEEEEQEEEEATDIKSNNPHLAGGEKHKRRFSCGLAKRQNMWETTNIPLTYIDHGESAANYKTTNTTNNSHRF